MLNNFKGRSLWLLPLLLIYSLRLQAQTVIDGVSLETKKENGVRFLKASKTIELPLSLDSALKKVINFAEKCNNSYKEKRKWTDKNKDCLFHNNNLIETIYYNEIKNKRSDLIDHFVLLRHGYNRGSFLYFEEVTIEKLDKNIRVEQRLLDDNELKNFIETKLATNFSFDKVKGTFELSTMSEKITKIHYTYQSETDHWLLNKDMMVDEIFESTAKGINDLFLSFTSGMNAP